MEIVIILDKGTTVHVNGIPVELEQSAFVKTTPGNVPLMFEEQKGAKSEQS